MGGWVQTKYRDSNSTLGWVELTWSGDGVELELDKKNDDGGCGGSAYSGEDKTLVNVLGADISINNA